MKVLRKLVAFLCCGMVLVSASSAVLAQKSVPPPEEKFGASTPKDNFTRAKLHTELGSLYFQGGNIIVALEELTIAISIDPNYATAYSTRGLALYYIQELESAEKDFKRALSLDEKNPDINNNYGWFLCQTGKEKEAIAYFQRALKNPLYQTPEVAFLNAGTCYIKLGDLPSAEDNIRRSLRFTPENPQALLQLARVSYLKGNYYAAKKQLSDVFRLNEPNAEALWLSLRVERRLGDSSAESSLEAQLRRKFPDSPEAQELLKGNFE